MAKAMVRDENGRVINTDIEFLEDDKKAQTAYEQAVGDLMEALNNAEGEDVLSVYKHVNGGRSKMSFCESFPPDKYSVDQLLMYIKTKFGGGDYRIQVRRPGQQGFLVNKLVAIESDSKSLQSAEGDGVTSQLLGYLDRMNDQMLQLNNGGGDRMDMMRELLMMKQIFDTPQQPQPDPMQQMMAMVTLLKECGVLGSTEKEEKEDNFMSFLGTMARPLSEIAGATMASAQNNARARQSQSAPQQESGTVDNLAIAMHSLVNAASKNSDPTLYCDWLIDQMSEDELVKVGTILRQDNWLELLTYYNPHVKGYSEWFNRLRDEIIAAFKEDIDGDYAPSDNIHD